MPYCKYIALHTTVDKSLRYILNPDKTEELLYTTSINCMNDTDSAYLQMQLVYNQFAHDRFDSPPPLEGKGTVKAIHYIQSFSPEDNVTPELAHKIAKAFVRKMFGDDAQAVIATHVDRQHLHSHIIINSYSLSGHKFYANKDSLKEVRRVSDGVCKALGVEINPNLTGKGKSIKRYEWEQRRKGTSWKEQIRQAIDNLIATVDSLDELLQALEERGYEVKRGKYISIRAPEQERFVRTKTLGEEYNEESLKTRILYREVGTGTTPELNNESKLRAAYIAIIGDVRVLASQHKKIQRNRIITAEYSADNDLDVYKMSAQLSVINKNNLHSIGEVEGEIKRLKSFYDKQRVEINEFIEEHNRLVSLWEQAQEFYSLLKKSKEGELSDTEKMRKAVCKQAMERNEILNSADVDALRRRVKSLSKRVSNMKDNLEKCRQRFEVYCDIRDTYNKISKGDYISNLVEEEKQRREQAKKKQKR